MSTQVKLSLGRTYEIDRIVNTLKEQRATSLKSGGARSIVLPLDSNPFGIEELVIEVDLTTEAYWKTMRQKEK